MIKIFTFKQQLFIVLFLACFTILSKAQLPDKKALTTDDFASWKLIPSKMISNNGKIIAYELNPLKGDGELVLKMGKHSTVFQRGYKAKISSENDFVVFRVKQPKDTLRKAKIDKLTKEKIPKDSLSIYNFKKERITTFPNVKSYALPEDNATWVAFLLKAQKEKKDTSQTKKSIKQTGDDLYLFNPHTSDTIKLKNITEYRWAKEGKKLVCIQQTKDSLNTHSVVKLFDVRSGNYSNLFSTQGWIKNATLDEPGEQCAFLLSKDTIKEKVYALYLSEKDNKPLKIIDELTKGMPIGWSPSENGKVYFSEDGAKLYLGTAEAPKEIPKDTLLDEEKPKLDVWNWKDKKLQPQQLLEVKREKKKTYLAAYWLNEKRFVQLADVLVSKVSLIQKGNGNIAFGYDSNPYQRASSWTGGGLRDYYLVDVKTGNKQQMVSKKFYTQLSPQGKSVIWWEHKDSSYYSISTVSAEKEKVALTKSIPLNFYNELHDIPTYPRPYGIAGWSKDDRFVYIYDRYDIWKIDLQGERVPVCVTKTFGRKNSTRLRYLKVNRELDYLPTKEKVLLKAFDERTMSSGYFATKLGVAQKPALLLMDKYRFGDLIKAKEADKIIWTKQNVKVFPDLWSSDLKFQHIKKISEANPQQKDFAWADVELVEWTSFSGEKLKGLLYKPEKLKPDYKYPMVVYFYERLSESLHTHIYPKPSHSTINKTFYASNNYLVFVPDITYTDGYPGQSAYNAIVSGTQHLIQKYRFIDRENIGLQGQSWGGYQTAWLITQTNLYAAAMAGAPVSNMTSAYGGILWGSGMSRMFQYEHTQSRIGGTLWEKPLLYLENSPVFHAPKISTPLLIMHNDNDGAVPWYQGIELFVALRRLDKPVWLLNYNGEPHNLPVKSWANRMDLSKRMLQFFDHYLKDKAAPEWMEKGVPAKEKGKKLGY